MGFAVNRLRGPRHNPPRSRQFYYEKMFSVFVPKQNWNLTGTIAQFYLFPHIIAHCLCLLFARHGMGALRFLSQSSARCGLRLHPLLFFGQQCPLPAPR